jgi:2-hydroxy-3-oxopropionate reductase
MTTSPLKLGFIGLGIMGAPMCGHLIKAGHQLFVHTVGKMPDAIAESSATVCTSARGVAERADIIFIMVPDTPDVEAVLFEERGVATRLSTGKVVVGMSRNRPKPTKH